MRKVLYLDIKWRASTSKPHQWLPSETAEALAATFQDMGPTASVGALLDAMPGGHDRLTCVDLDAARDADTGVMQPWADEVLRRFPSFTEFSPSGRGLHVLCFTTDDDLAAAGLIGGDAKARNVSWKGCAPDGEKAPGVDLLLTGFITVTGAALPGCVDRIARASVDALRWLAEELGPSLAGEPSRSPAPPPPTLRTAAPVPPRASVQAWAVRFSPSRMARLAEQNDDTPFRKLMLFWLHARKAHVAMWVTRVSYDEICSLPGARTGSRRMPAAMRAADRALAAKNPARVIQDRTPPFDGKPGLVIVRGVIAPFAHDPRSGTAPDLGRILAVAWQCMLTVPPRAFAFWPGSSAPSMARTASNSRCVAPSKPWE